MNLLNESQSTLEEFKGELTLDQERDLKEESDKLKDRFESCFKQVDGRLKLLGKLDLYEFNREEDSFARWFSNAGFCPIIDPLHPLLVFLLFLPLGVNVSLGGAAMNPASVAANNANNALNAQNAK